MNAFKKLSEVFDITESNLSGCVDIICVEQPDATLKSSSFHVRFGKFKVLKSKEKVVTIKVNDHIQSVKMKMDQTGEAYFEDIREENMLEKMINAGLSSDDAFSDYEVPNMQSDDEGAFDKEKINEQISKNQYRFDDLISPQKEGKEAKANAHAHAHSQTNQQNQNVQPQNQNAIPHSQQSEKKGGGFWSFFRGKKKDDESISNQPSRKNSENVNVEDLQKVVQEQAKDQNREEGKQSQQEGTSSTQAPSSSVNSNNGVPSSDIENEVDRFVINDEMQEKNKNSTNGKAQPQQTSASKSKVVNNPSTQQFKEDKYKMNEVVENLEKKKSPQIEKKASIETGNELLERKESQKSLLPNSQNQISASTATVGSDKKIEDKKKDGKETSKVDMKDIIDQNKDLKELIAAKKHEKQQIIVQETAQIKEEQEEEANEEEEEDEEEGEMEIGLSLCNNIQQKKGENKTLEQLFEENQVTYEQFSQDPMKILSDKNLLLKIGYHLYPWEIAATILVSRLAFKQEIPDSVLQNMIKQQKKKSSSGFFDFLFRRNKEETTPQKKQNEVEAAQSKEKTGKKDVSHLQINPGEKNELQANSPIQSPKSEDNLDMRNRKMSDELSVVSDTNSTFGSKMRVRKTFKPKSDILKSFNLKPGANKISFHVETAFGEQTLDGYIYLWPNNTQIVISDIDGTITRSDVLGQLMPMVDKDWTHDGVVQLYQNIVKNGYQVLYLTARAIGQSEQTRKFIYGVKQDHVNLPLGPIIMSSDRLLKSFKREVIDKKPEVFKIAVLREIQSLFPNKSSVYYAGFGNRETDAVAYRAVQISLQKIYIINPASELHQLNNTFKKTYLQLNDMVDQGFPPIKHEEDQVQDEYNSFNFWKINPPVVDDINQLLHE